VILLNWQASPKKIKVKLDKPCEIRDYWTGETLGNHSGSFTMELPGHDGRVLLLKPKK
jgi:alpha-galactosidase